MAEEGIRLCFMYYKELLSEHSRLKLEIFFRCALFHVENMLDLIVDIDSSILAEELLSDFGSVKLFLKYQIDSILFNHHIGFGDCIQKARSETFNRNLRPKYREYYFKKG